MFDTLTIRDARPIAWLKRGTVAVFAALLVMGGLSTHRAYFQVRNLKVKAPQLLMDGSVVEVAVVCSGRNRVGVEAELIQGEHSEARAWEQSRLLRSARPACNANRRFEY